jgi:hypothetical protein
MVTTGERNCMPSGNTYVVLALIKDKNNRARTYGPARTIMRIFAHALMYRHFTRYKMSARFYHPHWHGPYTLYLSQLVIVFFLPYR